MTKTQILIPAAGQGSRYVAAGFVDPKPFIWSPKRKLRLLEIAIEDSVNALGGADGDAGTIHVLLRAEHVARGRDLLDGRAEIIPVGALTNGAASTIQLAEPYLDPNAPLFVVNSDQTFKFRGKAGDAFTALRQCEDVAAIPLCFTSKGESKWSYYDPASGTIVEKPATPPQGNTATLGAYWFRRAGDVFAAIRAMKADRFKVNGEYYFAPCHNYLGAVTAGRVAPVFVSRFAGLGTPEDFTRYERSFEAPPERAAHGTGQTDEERRAGLRDRQNRYQVRRKAGFQRMDEE